MVERTPEVEAAILLTTLHAANLKISTIIHSGDFQKIAGELEQEELTIDSLVGELEKESADQNVVEQSTKLLKQLVMIPGYKHSIVAKTKQLAEQLL